MSDQRLHGTEGARVLRAVSHPLRNRILAELEAGGPMRAADIAERIDIPANQASFHLRQLAKYELVEEAPELARDGRERVWRASSKSGLSISLREMEETPDGAAAVAVYRRHATAEAHRMVDQITELNAGPECHRMFSDQALRLTFDEAQEFTQALSAFVDEWRERTAGTGDDRQTHRLMMMMQPYESATED
ncbi:MAG: ArsR/SmtB family transcription factor [Marmoricola sp.]